MKTPTGPRERAVRRYLWVVALAFGVIGAARLVGAWVTLDADDQSAYPTEAVWWTGAIVFSVLPAWLLLLAWRHRDIAWRETAGHPVFIGASVASGLVAMISGSFPGVVLAAAALAMVGWYSPESRSTRSWIQQFVVIYVAGLLGVIFLRGTLELTPLHFVPQSEYSGDFAHDRALTAWTDAHHWPLLEQIVVVLALLVALAYVIFVWRVRLAVAGSWGQRFAVAMLGAAPAVLLVGMLGTYVVSAVLGVGVVLAAVAGKSRSGTPGGG